MRTGFATVIALMAVLIFWPAIAPGTAIVDAQSLPETAEAIAKARVTTRVLFITAHPDDEWSSLLTYLSRGLNADVGLLTITRGQGGQNAIGPEQDGQLGVIRTEELLAAGSYYSVRQFFTRAVDTGYSKSPKQTMKIWGQVPLEDMVRVIRTFRPQVVINGWGGVHSGHGQHQASGLLTPQAVAEAADPNAFPEQLSEGLEPWKVTLELRFARDGAKDAVELPVGEVSALWGKSYTQMGMEGHAQHRSQGTPAFFGNRFFSRPIYLVTENAEGQTGSFDSKLLAEPLSSLATRFGSLESAMKPALESADQQLAAAEKAVLSLDRSGAARSLARAGQEVAQLHEGILKGGQGNTKDVIWEIDRETDKINRALADDIALPIQTQADRHELVAGETFGVDVLFSGAPAVPVKWALKNSSLLLPPGWSANLAKSESEGEESYRYRVSVPAGAKAPHFPGDVILPFPPALVRLMLTVNCDEYSFTIERPVMSVQATTTGISTYPLELVPAVTLAVEPRQIMLPIERDGAPVQLLARVRYHGTQPVKAAIGLDVPGGWKAEPVNAVDFSSPGNQLIRFTVNPPSHPATGGYTLRPYARIGEQVFRTSLEPIPTLPTRDWSEPDDASVHVLDLVVPKGLHIGYVAAENDPLPEILRQIGIRVDLLDDVALAFGDLSRYDAIVVGIRAYELRSDLPQSNGRLLRYVQNGGSLVVQYERDFAWEKFMPAPYPAQIADGGTRVTNPDSPVRFLAPDNPLLNTPNKITAADFKGWVQERGIYFWNTFDPRYQAILGLTDYGEPETKGSLLYTRDGKGVYIYTGLSFFRELPAGVPGVYRLFVNLLSQTPRGPDQD